MDTQIISFYTSDYRIIAERLIRSLQGYKYTVEEIDDKGTWHANANYKPAFILNKLLEKKTPVLWLDADAEVVGDISYFDTLSCDIGVHKYNNVEMLTSTVFFAFNTKVLCFIVDWMYECKNNPVDFYGDQRNFQKVLETIDLNVEYIPAKYAKIYDLMKDVEDARVVQHQASRHYKNKGA